MDGYVVVDTKHEINVWTYDDEGTVGVAVSDRDNRATAILNEAQAKRLVVLLDKAIGAIRASR